MPKILRTLLNHLPVVLPAMVAAFGFVVMALLLPGWLNSWLVWSLGILAALATAFLIGRFSPVGGGGRERFICDFLVLAGVLAWGLFNSYYASEHLFTNRDPATYATTAVWLINHDSLQIGTPAVFGDSPNITAESPGFSHPQNRPETVHSQGQHLLPVLLGLAGRITGEDLVLRLAPWFGALALLAVYGFARLLVKPRWALAAAAVLAATLPMIHFSRDTYTEPLSVVFVFSGLALLWQAQKTNSKLLWLIAGLVVGAGALVRIDSYITLIALAGFITILLAVTGKKDRKATLAGVGLFVLSVLAVSVLAWFDLTMLSAPYFEVHKHLIYRELLALLAAVVVGGLLVAVSWRTGFVAWLDKRTKAWRIPALAAVIVVTAAVLVSRPLWMESQNSTGVVSPYYASIQVAEGNQPEPRNYHELTTFWVSWYVGAFAALLGVVGLMVLASRVFKKEHLPALAFVLVFAATALLYFVLPSVASDQLWASRRMLPVVIPGTVILAVIALQLTEEKLLRGRRARAVFFVLTLATMLVTPLTVSAPFVFNRDTNQKPLFTGLCQALPQNAAVLWLGEGQYYNVQATRSFCNVPTSAYLPTDVNRAELAEAAKNATSAGYVPVVAVFAGQKHLLGEDQQNLRQVSAHSYKEMELRLTSPPQKNNVKTYEFLIGTLNSNGSVSTPR